jgi:hypothetical protein
MRGPRAAIRSLSDGGLPSRADVLTSQPKGVGHLPPTRWPTLLAVGVGCIISSCGYRPMLGALGTRPVCRVEVASSLVADVVAADEVAVGLRSYLGRMGRLQAGASEVCAVEVLRVDEEAEAIAVGEGTLRPEARGLRISVVARAWRQRTEGALREADTGDERAWITIAPTHDASQAIAQRASAVRAAARQVGERLGQRLVW